MPFMRGAHPVRRSIQYLSKSNLILKPFIRIVAIHYNRLDNGSQGARDFVYWNLPQLKYKNPDVQCITFRNLTPSPFFRIFFDSGKDLLMDVDRQSKDEIVERVLRTLCKSSAELAEEAKASAITANPASWGYGCKRQCICEIPGQVPCPSIIPLPYHMRGRYRMGFAELDESKYL